MHVRTRELIHTLRQGGPAALDAARKLVAAGPTRLSAAEAREVKQLLPTLKDLYGAKVADGISALLSGHEATLPPALETLLPRLENVALPQLPQRFATDLQLVRPQLTNHPALAREEKAERLFAFAVPFAEKLAQAPADTKPALAAKLVENAANAGFAQLVDQPTRRDGTQVLAQLVQAQTPEQVQEQVKTLQLDAPSWPQTPAAEQMPSPAAAEEKLAMPIEVPVKGPAPSERETAAQPEREAKAAAQPGASGTPQPSTDRLLLLQPNARRRDDPGPERAPDDERRTNKRLGPMMLWNVLHLFRDDGVDGRDSAKQRDELNRLAIGMAFAIGMLALIAIVLVMSRM
jgi:hypothetical protein